MSWQTGTNASHHQEHVPTNSPTLEDINRWSPKSSATTCGGWHKRIATTSKDIFRNQIADTFCRIGLGKSQFSVEVCQSFAELLRCYELLYTEYSARGYCRENAAGLHLSLSAILPTTLTLALKHKGQIVGTISLLKDSPIGLPMESLFPHEVAKARRSQQEIAEVGLLALDLRFFGHHRYSLTDWGKFCGTFHLFRAVFHYARSQRITDLLIAVHPKHQSLYNYITFQSLGPVKSYPGACGAPALPLKLNIPSAQASKFEGRKSLFSFFDSYKISGDARRYALSEQSLRYLFSSRKDIFCNLTAKESAHLYRCFPEVVLANHERQLVASG